MNDIVLKIICIKYNMEIKLNFLCLIEKEILWFFRLDGIDDFNIFWVVFCFYWLLMYEDLQNKIDEFNRNF